MRRQASAALIAILAVAAVAFESSPAGLAIRSLSAAWLAANALPKNPEKVTAVELPPGARSMAALDAALVLRAVLRYQPKGIGFFAPLDPGGDAALLVSKLQDAKKVPVAFTAGGGLAPMPGVTASRALPKFRPAKSFVPEGYAAGGLADAPAGQVAVAGLQGEAAAPSAAWSFCLAMKNLAPADTVGRIPGEMRAGKELTPVNEKGCADLNVLAPGYVERIAFAQLVLETERSETGMISARLDGLFRGRAVVVQPAGSGQAEGVAGLCNRLTDFSPDGWPALALVVLAATLPWWHAKRAPRAMLALMAACACALMALAFYAEFRLVAPLSIPLLLPLLALIPSGEKGAAKSDEVQQGELPA